MTGFYDFSKNSSSLNEENIKIKDIHSELYFDHPNTGAELLLRGLNNYLLDFNFTNFNGRIKNSLKILGEFSKVDYCFY